MLKLYYLLLLLTSFNLCAQDSIYTLGWHQLIPSTNLPKEFNIRNSNNNLDIIKYKKRYYVAFRTAPTHFASKKTMTYIMSSLDFENWRYENEFYVGADMREPRFVIFKDCLYFYFFEGGKNMFRFQPKHIWMSSTFGNGKWSVKQNTGLNGYVPWRFKSHNDKIYLSAYYGIDLYKNKHKAELRLFTSHDGLSFTPISKEAQITTKGAEEGEFVFDNEGNLWATIRLEGSGSYIVFASKDSLHIWQHWFSKHKYDSALMFEHNDEIYVIARRHIKGPATDVEIPSAAQRRNNLIKYSFSKKYTAIYKLDKKNYCLNHLFDFPSTGDNAFPGIAKIDNNSYYLLNYSSDIHKKEKNWITGQFGKTFIYSTILTFKK
ncbi:MAG: hypothetical protein MK207_05245 [Saprospiraceae bacterium]|nr:hypothetical protein [Saprospiraceae bacterium]